MAFLIFIIEVIEKACSASAHSLLQQVLEMSSNISVRRQADSDRQVGGAIIITAMQSPRKLNTNVWAPTSS